MAPVRTEREGHVLTITVDRPEVMNCIDGEAAVALAAAWDTFADDDELWVTILTGAGDRAFCSGADLHALDTLGPGLDASDEDRERFVEEGDGYLGGTRRTDLDKPILAAVNGLALAGGLELACMADLRIAAEHATFGVTCRKWNVPLVDGGTQRLPRIVGMGHAMDLILTGRTIDAREAQRMGLVNEVVARGAALSTAKALADGLCSLPQEAMRADKHAAMGGWGLPLAEGLRIEAREGDAVIGTDAFREGVARFQERRR